MQWISFKYEQLPFFYFYCGQIGHGERVCEAKMKDAENARLNEGQYGDWLRGINMRVVSKGKGQGVKKAQLALGPP